LFRRAVNSVAEDAESRLVLVSMLVCRLRAIKQALLNVGERSPAEVLSYVLDAVRAAMLNSSGRLLLHTLAVRASEIRYWPGKGPVPEIPKFSCGFNGASAAGRRRLSAWEAYGKLESPKWGRPRPHLPQGGQQGGPGLEGHSRCDKSRLSPPLAYQRSLNETRLFADTNAGINPRALVTVPIGSPPRQIADRPWSDVNGRRIVVIPGACRRDSNQRPRSQTTE
jgi:hypothetical protein